MSIQEDLQVDQTIFKDVVSTIPQQPKWMLVRSVNFSLNFLMQYLSMPRVVEKVLASNPAMRSDDEKKNQSTKQYDYKVVSQIVHCRLVKSVESLSTLLVLSTHLKTNDKSSEYKNSTVMLSKYCLSMQRIKANEQRLVLKLQILVTCNQELRTF